MAILPNLTFPMEITEGKFIQSSLGKLLIARNSELDPHGAYGDGNPIGGNVTSNVTGTDLHYTEWMVRFTHLP